MELTTCQARALDLLGPVFAGQSPGSRGCLSGPAGTGKTFILGRLASLARTIPLCNGIENNEDEDRHHAGRWSEKPSVLFLAPTHKAARQIQKAMVAMDVVIPVRTIHSALAIRPVRQDGKELFLPDTKADLLVHEGTRLVIIDELSMVGDELLLLLDKALPPGAAMVGVGDKAQLPPVGEIDPCALFEAPLKVELSEVVRHGGPILSLATATRLMLQGRPPFTPASTDKSSVICHHGQREWCSRAIQSCVKADSDYDYDAARILCWTNANADKANRAVHAAIYGKDAPPYLIGQPVVSHGPILPTPVELGAGPGLPLVQGSTELFIDEASLKEDRILGDDLLPTEPPWLHWSIEATVIGEMGNKAVFHVIDPSDEKRWRASLREVGKMARSEEESDRKSALWKVFWFRKDYFASVKPIWAMTIHKSQGSTFREVFLHPDLDWNRDLIMQCRLAYVGITRASNVLHVCGDHAPSRRPVHATTATQP